MRRSRIIFYTNNKLSEEKENGGRRKKKTERKNQIKSLLSTTDARLLPRFGVYDSALTNRVAGAAIANDLTSGFLVIRFHLRARRRRRLLSASVYSHCVRDPPPPTSVHHNLIILYYTCVRSVPTYLPTYIEKNKK